MHIVDVGIVYIGVSIAMWCIVVSVGNSGVQCAMVLTHTHIGHMLAVTQLLLQVVVVLTHTHE